VGIRSSWLVRTVKVVERFGDTAPADHHTMAAVEQDAPPAHRLRQPLAFSAIGHEAVEGLVKGDLVEKAARVLVAHRQPTRLALCTAEGSRIGLVCMEDARVLFRVCEVDGAMDFERGSLDWPLAGNDHATRIDTDQVFGCHLRPRQPILYHQESITARDHRS
jgi:hypothetical protein